MTNELEFYGNPVGQTGLTVVARIYDEDGVQVGGDISCAEVGVLAIYQGDMPATGSGAYGVRFFSGTTLLATGCISWDGTQEVQADMLDVIENSLTKQGVMRLMLSSLAGKLSGAGTTNIKIRNTADDKDRIDATVDSVGNRTVVTLDVS